ncbi:MAG: hypothetical protein JRN06_01450 [Nitrososphaerota archaeon]|nr:hypothetical protein [Nitrososphaerota archaeon]MDG7023482.1 hypothetical protein [Nitrososphaerota archaeon]
MPSKGLGIFLVPVASSLHDPASTERVLCSYRKWLGSVGVTEAPLATSPEGVGRGGLGNATGLVALVLTGGTEQTVGAVAKLGKPLLVLAHDSMNSLPAALEATSSISGRGTRLVFGKGRRQLAAVRGFAHALEVLTRIRSHRIGLVGGPSSWLTYSLPDAEGLANRLGIRVVDIPMQEFRGVHSSASKQAVRVVQSGAGEVTASDLEKSEAIYLALKALSERHGLSSVSPRCFDFIKDFGATGCLALSRLNDEGVVAGCEGDIPSTVGMITLSELSGRPAFMGNPSFIEGHRLVLAHCTVAGKLTKKVRYRSHFESGMGVGIAGELRKGARVTVARYGKGYGLLRAGAGTIVRGTPWSDDLCRTQADIRMDGNAEVFLQRPTGNHLVMTYGDHVEPLRQLASAAGLEFEEV